MLHQNQQTNVIKRQIGGFMIHIRHIQSNITGH